MQDTSARKLTEDEIAQLRGSNSGCDLAIAAVLETEELVFCAHSRQGHNSIVIHVDGATKEVTGWMVEGPYEWARKQRVRHVVGTIEAAAKERGIFLHKL